MQEPKNILFSQDTDHPIDERHDQEMEDAAMILSQDPELTEIEFSFEAQSEVVLSSR